MLRSPLSNLFYSENYISFLNEILDSGPEARGQRSRLARFLGCQTSFVSQVLTARAHLGREQALRVAEFLKMPPEETRYFMLLVDRDRAGTQQLRQFYQFQLEQIVKQREEVKEKIGVRHQITDDAKLTYYSSWLYAAIHVLSALPQGKDVYSIAKFLNVSQEKVAQIVEWLVHQGLIKIEDERLAIGPSRIHIGSQSPLVGRHHANWRIKSLEYVERPHPESLHYSAVYGISLKETRQLKEMLLEFLRNTEPLIGEATEEVATVLLLDLFLL